MKALFHSYLNKHQVIYLEVDAYKYTQNYFKQEVMDKALVSKQGNKYLVTDKGKETVFQEESSETEPGSSFEKEKHMAHVLTELEETINAIPCSPNPNPHTKPYVFQEFEENLLM